MSDVVVVIPRKSSDPTARRSKTDYTIQRISGAFAMSPTTHRISIVPCVSKIDVPDVDTYYDRLPPWLQRGVLFIFRWTSGRVFYALSISAIFYGPWSLVGYVYHWSDGITVLATGLYTVYALLLGIRTWSRVFVTMHPGIVQIICKDSASRVLYVNGTRWLYTIMAIILWPHYRNYVLLVSWLFVAVYMTFQDASLILLRLRLPGTHFDISRARTRNEMRWRLVHSATCLVVDIVRHLVMMYVATIEKTTDRLPSINTAVFQFHVGTLLTSLYMAFVYFYSSFLFQVYTNGGYGQTMFILRSLFVIKDRS